MSFDDELAARMKSAAEAAGAQADPAAAAEYLATHAGTGSAAPGIGLKLIAGLGGLGLIAGLTLGATVLQSDGASEAASAAALEAIPGSVFDCPDGEIVGQLRPGDRVLVIGTDESNDWSAIRDPRQLSRAVWVRNGALTADTGADTDDLPELACPDPSTMLVVGSAPPSSVVTDSSTSTTSTSSTSSTTSTTSTSSTSTTSTTSTTTTVAPTTTRPATTTIAPPPVTTLTPTTTVAVTVGPTTTVAPTTTQPPDTQKPTIQASANPLEIYDQSWPECDNESQLTAFASDNVGVTGVTATWSGRPGSPLALTFSNGAWRGQFGPFGGGLPMSDVTITLTARDAAGNTQATAVVVRVWPECLL